MREVHEDCVKKLETAATLRNAEVISSEILDGGATYRFASLSRERANGTQTEVTVFRVRGRHYRVTLSAQGTGAARLREVLHSLELPGTPRGAAAP